METKLPRAFLIELIGAFGLVLFSAGLPCVNQMAQPATAGTAPVMGHQPGLVGIALGQGLILAAMLAITAPLTGGYLNPAITMMLWVFGRLETPRVGALIGAQFLGGVLAAVCLRFMFDGEVLQAAQFGAPHLNPLAYHSIGPATLLTGTAIELLLTFFLVFAIFSLGGDALKLGMAAGMIATACALFGFPLTGAALNPARWLGPTLLEAISTTHLTRNPWADTLVYLAGPILGSLLAGLCAFKLSSRKLTSATGRPEVDK